MTISHAMLYARLNANDHVMPAMVRLPDGHVIAAYTGHRISNGFYISRTTAPNDISQWSAPVNIGQQIIVEPGHNSQYSYNYLFRLSGEAGRIYLITRESDMTVGTAPGYYDGEWWVISWSDDGGATWTRAKRLWGPQRPYTRAWSNNVDRIDFFFNDSHPALDTTNDVHHCYYKAGALYRSNGTLITTMANLSAAGIDRFTDPTLVYSVTGSGLGNAWVYDLTYEQATARPVGTFVTFRSNYTLNDYYQARWSGTAWSYHKICQAGFGLIALQAAYTGGVITDPEDINTVYLSRQVDADGNVTKEGVYQLFKYVTADGGATWTGTQLTFGADPSFRPIIPPTSRKLFYVTGDYGPNYVNFHTRVAVLDIGG